MNILVINAGSSSLKYQLLNPETGVLLAKGLCERIGIDGKFTYKPQIEGKQVLDAVDVAMPTHSEAIQAVLNALVDKDNGVIGSMKEIDAVGHRVVHGGEAFNKSVLITDEVMKALEDCISNDPTNGGRALVLLAKAGLITLKDGVGFKATVADITSNPKNIKIQELEAAQLPRSLDDVTIAVIPMNYVQSAGLSVEKQGFFFESKDEPLTVIVLAVRSEDKDNETYKKIADIYKSDAIKQFINDTFKGSITSAN